MPAERLRHRADRQDLLERRHLLQQPQRPFDEHRVRVDDQRRDPGVGQHIRVIVQRAERV